MKHLLIILSFLLLSSPLFGDNHKGETLYFWETSSGLVWKGFGDKETQPKYQGDVKNGKPNGLGFLIYPKRYLYPSMNGTRYVGSWVNGEIRNGTVTDSNGSKYVGSWKDWGHWNGTSYDKDGNIKYKWVNGVRQ